MFLGILCCLYRTSLEFEPAQYGKTPLHYAAAGGHDEAITVLVQEGGARLRMLDRVRSSHCAVGWLLDTNVSCTQNGRTPLECAGPGSTTHALLTEMELVGADERVLTKSAARRFGPLHP